MAAGDVSVSLTNPIGYPCAAFDGVNDVATIPTITGIEGFEACTVLLWIRINTPFTGGYRNFLNLGYTSPDYGILGWINNTSDQIRFTVKTPGGTADTDAMNFTAGTWYHIGVIYDGVNMRGVLNSSMSSLKALTGKVTLNPKSITLGFSGAAYANCFIRDLVVYNRVLTQAEIDGIYNSGIYPTDYIGYWALNGDVNDKSKNNNNGTSNGNYFIGSDTAVAAVIKAARTGATDNYLITEVNGKILSVVIDEA